MEPTPTTTVAENLDPKSLSTLDLVRSLAPERSTATEAEKQATPKAEPEKKDDTLDIIKDLRKTPEAAPEKKKEETPEKKDAPEEEDDDGLSDFAKSLLKEDDTDEDKSKEKADDTDEEPEEKLPDTASESAKAAFKKVNGDRSRLKKELKALQEEKAELTKQLQEGNPDVVKTIQEELKTTKEQYAEAQRVIKALDVKASDEWKSTIDEPMKALREKADKLVEHYDGLDSRVVRRLIADGDTKQLAKLLNDAEVNSFDQAEFANIRQGVLKLSELKANLEKDAEEAAQILTNAQKQRFEQQEAQKKASYTQARDNLAKGFQKDYPQLFAKVEGDAAWNEAVDFATNFAQNADPTQLTTEQMGQAMAMAAVAPVATARLIQREKDLAILAAKYKKMLKTTPKVEPSQGTKAPVATDSDDTLSVIQSLRNKNR